MMNKVTIAAMMLGAGLALNARVPAAAAPFEDVISYQGQLSQNGTPVSGTRDLRFRLFDAETGGSQTGSVTLNDVDIDAGVFAVELDFGVAPWPLREQQWVEVAVSNPGANSYEVVGRQKLTASPYALNVRGIATDANGVVGIGTRFPYSTSRMTISQGDLAAPANGNSPLVVVKNSGGAFINVLAPVESGLLLGDAGNSAAGGVVYGHQSDALGFRTNGNQTRMIIDADGNVGVGTVTPGSRLEVRGPGAWPLSVTGPANPGIRFVSDNSGSLGTSWALDQESTTGDFRIRDSFDARTRFTIKGSTGFVGIGTSTPTTKLDVDGAVTIRGGADIVEGFESICDTAFEPGTVLVIDPANPGMLMCAEGAYDKKVAGVVSGAGGVQPGIKLGQSGVLDGDIPVAMTGRVYVKCSTENGSIEPGDLLTTASLAGHAMKATDDARSNGTVIGKAMGTLNSGEGLVLVLVNLQ